MPVSKDQNIPGKVMVIGLDGATWDLIRPWIAQGALPNLASHIERGVAADMISELPPSSVPNWPAFMTGKNAGKHGCFWWLQRDKAGNQDSVPIDSRSVRGDTIWSYLSANGKKVIVQNVPVTYPVEPVNGVMISGLLTPRTATDFVYPASLKPQIDSISGGYEIYPDDAFAYGQEESFITGQIKNIEQHAATAEHLLNTNDWNFFMLVIGPTDEAAHKIWHFMDPTHPRYKADVDKRLQEGLFRIYSAADEAVGQLTKHLGPDDSLIIMSDHGFGPVDSFFHLNNWLVREGYLSLKKTGSTLLKRALYKIGFTPSNIFPIGKQLLSYFRGSNVMRQRLDPGRQGSKTPLRKILLTTEDIDWSRTRAVATGFLFGQIFVNLRGREPQGIVAQEEYDALCQELITKLSTVYNPIRNQVHYRSIERREALYSGPYLDLLPDLLCIPRDLRSPDSGMGFRSNKLFDFDTALSGTHRERGIFIMHGPGIHQGESINPIHIYDIAPTIYYCLNLPVPDDLDGKFVSSAFEDGFLETHQITQTKSQPTRSAGQTELSAEEEESIKKRLQDLGYLN